jgi:hypothetical protein
MNLSQGNGRVPIPSGQADMPYLLVDFPTREVFDSLYGSRSNVDRKWAILNTRVKGATLTESGKQYDLSRERVRQIEAMFIRLYHLYWQRTNA